MPALYNTPAKKYKTNINININNNNNKQSTQQGKPVEVFCRLRHVNHQGKEPCVTKLNDTVAQLHSEYESYNKQYTFSHVFDQNATQKDVFERVGLPLVEQLVQGNNGLLFTYGVTSSGKTYTIQGSPANCGLLPRTVDVLFSSIEDKLCKEAQIKPDGRNFFKVQTDPDWMHERVSNRNEKISATPNKTPSLVKWLSRAKDSNKIRMDSISHNTVFCVFVSLVELYTYKRIVDLLDDPNIADRNKRKPVVVDDPSDPCNCYVANVTEKEVRSANEALEVLNRGLARRTTARTALNHESSRSHCLFNIRLVQARGVYKDKIDEDSLSTSQLCLVDLAGMERQDRSEATGKTLNEASSINNTLMSLRECIKALRDDRRSVNVDALCRGDNLTRLFKSFFKGFGRIRIILCVNPKMDEYNENVNALEFGAKAKEVVVPSSVKATPLSHLTNYRERLSYLDEDKIDLPLPNLDMPVDDENFSSYFSGVIGAFQQRRQRRERQRARIDEKTRAFRANLIKFENKMVSYEKELDGLLREKKIHLQQLTDLENDIDSLKRKNENQSHERDALAREKMSLRNKLAQEQKKFTSLQASIEAIDGRARDEERRIMLRELKKRSSSSRDKRSLSKKPDTVTTTSNTRAAEDWSRAEPSAPHLSPLITPTSESPESNTPQPTIVSSSERMTLRSRSPTRAHADDFTSPEQGIAVHNRKHMRSLSTGSSPWLYHRPSGTFNTGTVLIPKIKNKKTVTNIKSSHLIGKNAPEIYCLTHQEADVNGTVMTSVFKGPIIPTRGHGVSVVIDDIEVTRQQSPPATRKRAASDNLSPPTTRKRAAGSTNANLDVSN